MAGQVRQFQGANSANRQGPSIAARFPGLIKPVAHLRLESGLRCVALYRTTPALSSRSSLAAVSRPEEVIAGEVLVRFESVLSAEQALAMFKAAGVTLEHAGFSSQWLHLLRMRHSTGDSVSDEQTRELAQRLANFKGVRFATPNTRAWALAVPNDNLYAAQWHYPAMNLPAAWEVSTGSANVVTAILDTGIVPHPDLMEKVIAGIDLISDPSAAGDGDGRDDNPTDEGRDLPQGQSSWHGTHVAGTVGAATNNTSGVSGVDWQTRLLPVRVLGRGGGSVADIAAGITWASGGVVPGVRANSTPAQVLNMSLGGQGPADPAYQDVIDQATARGSLVIVAAGNDNVNAGEFRPCNQQNVICVGATRFNGQRASYSNYGARIDVMAPGGEVGEDRNGDGYPDGVLSTTRNGMGMPSYGFEQGTSMASPHVAGLAALMKGAAPNLSFAQLRAALTSTANGDFRCQEGCGAGLVNASAALRSVSGMMATGPGRLVVSATELFFTQDSTSQSVSVSNIGGQPLEVTLMPSGPLSLSPPGPLMLMPNQATRIIVSANFAGVPMGVTTHAIVAQSTGGAFTINARLRVGGAATTDVAIGLVYQVDDEWKVAGVALAQTSTQGRYTVSGGARSYYIFGWADLNGNGEVESNEPVGLYPNSDSPKEVVVTAGGMLTGIDFTVAPEKPISDGMARLIGTPCSNDGMCGTGSCITAWPMGYCSQNCAMAACPLGSTCVQATDTVRACLDTCSGPGMGQSSCRASYNCYRDGTGGGICLPRCASADDCDGQPCDTTTGYCE